MPEYRIGEAARALDVSVDTLRYYEKRGLLPAVARNAARVRLYSDKDISRLKFIRRAQRMNFSLDEIEILDSPNKCRLRTRAPRAIICGKQLNFNRLPLIHHKALVKLD